MKSRKSTGINFASNIVFYIAKLIIGIIALPVCLHAFGEEQYGLYLLGFGLSSSLTVFDFGASRSIFRYTIEYQEDKNTEKYASALSGAWSLNAIAAVIIGCILIILGFFSKSLFHLSPEAGAHSRNLFLLAGINASILTINTAPQLLLQAKHYFHKRNTWQYIPLLGNLTLLLLTGPAHLSLITFAAVSCVLSGAGLLIDALLVQHTKIIRDIPVRFTLRPTVASNFARTSFAHAAISFLSVQADRLIIGSVLNVSAVTTYTIITKPYFLLRGLISAGYPTFQPALSEAYLSGQMERYRQLSSRIIRVSFILVVCMCGFLTAFFYPLLETWVHSNNYHPFAQWGMLSMVTICMTMLYTPHFRTLSNSAQLSSIVRFSMLSVPVNVIVSIMLSNAIGFQGVIIGTLIQICGEAVFIYYVINKNTAIRPQPIPVKYAIIAACVIAGSYILSKQLYTAHTFTPSTLLYIGTFLVWVAIICIPILKQENLFKQLRSNL